jgi:hypothetical protein
MKNWRKDRAQSMPLENVDECRRERADLQGIHCEFTKV